MGDETVQRTRLMTGLRNIARMFVTLFFGFLGLLLLAVMQVVLISNWEDSPTRILVRSSVFVGPFFVCNGVAALYAGRRWAIAAKWQLVHGFALPLWVLWDTWQYYDGGASSSIPTPFTILVGVNGILLMMWVFNKTDSVFLWIRARWRAATGD